MHSAYSASVAATAAAERGSLQYHAPVNGCAIYKNMVEPLLSGIVLGLVPVNLAGLFVTAYIQYRRGDQLNL